MFSRTIPLEDWKYAICSAISPPPRKKSNYTSGSSPHISKYERWPGTSHGTHRPHPTPLPTPWSTRTTTNSSSKQQTLCTEQYLNMLPQWGCWCAKWEWKPACVGECMCRIGVGRGRVKTGWKRTLKFYGTCQVNVPLLPTLQLHPPFPKCVLMLMYRAVPVRLLCSR